MKAFRLFVAVLAAGASIAALSTQVRANGFPPSPVPVGGDKGDNGDHGGNGDHGDKGGHGDRGGKNSVPEIDPAGVTSMASLLIGGVALVTTRRRK